MIKVRPAGIVQKPIGIVKDTEHVREIEEKKGCNLVGYSASWNDKFRTYIYDKQLNQWRGVYPLTAEDLQPFEDHNVRR